MVSWGAENRSIPFLTLPYPRVGRFGKQLDSRPGGEPPRPGYASARAPTPGPETTSGMERYRSPSTLTSKA